MNWLSPLKCPICGAKFDENERYCPGCGTDLEAPMNKDPEMARIHFRKAKQKYDKGNILPASALTDCELAIEYDPDFAEAHNLHGSILDALNRTEEAITAYREALRLNPNLDEAKANLRDAEEEVVKNSSRSSQKMNLEDSNKLIKLVLRIVFSFVVLVTVVIGGWLAFQFVIPYLTPKTEIVLLPDVPAGVLIEQSDLKLAAQVMTDRAHLLGYSEVFLRSRPMVRSLGRFQPM